MSKYQKHTFVTGLKEMQSILSSVVQQLPTELGCSAGDYECAFKYRTTISEEYEKAIKNLLKVQEECNRNDTGPDDMHTLHKTKCDVNARFEKISSGTVYKLANGMQVDLNILTYSASLGVDINGDKGPNEIGRDIFLFNVAKETRNGIPAGTILPAGSKIYSIYYGGGYWKDSNLCTKPTPAYAAYETTPQKAIHCAGRVLEEGAMNY